ncbi:uncharacterized protein THITE_2117008 [Thermothielavioides terrestris NRRL 8126]|uniref:Uncharacterized protein n=1 Tax=Thermothielavioides terrestris (strain ATCC 38088 / NRRL 8126) TaxID=578455 RepID=G2R7F9_THETT|nr:uncharacterized protein THITE_2117008 [Thermothielavioides terrestris NRRL 8126]AEO67868.1 hypothetical protein THITE_2117008 [Thermothielavioides terrestris NRRL 8126]
MLRTLAFRPSASAFTLVASIPPPRWGGIRPSSAAGSRTWESQCVRVTVCEGRDQRLARPD